MPTLQQKQFLQALTDENGVHRSVMALGVIILAPLFFALGNIIYNLFFHQLRKYPGPLIARATKLWHIYHMVQGTLPHAVKAAHDKYGPVVRTSPTDLSYTDPQAFKDIYGHRSGVSENGKEPLDQIWEGHTHIIHSEREEHSMYRRLLSNGFSDKALREQQPTIQKYISLFFQQLKRQSEGGQKPLNMVDWYNFVTFDIIGDMAYGESFDCLSGSGYHPWVKMILTSIHASVRTAAIQRLGSAGLAIKNFILPKKMDAARKQVTELVYQKMLRRVEHRPEYTDLMQNVVNAMDNGKLNMDQVSTHARVLTIAGSETTATLLSGATYFLCNNPSAMQKLKDEVRSTFKSEDEIDYISATKLPYLMAVLDESLRKFPPAADSRTRRTPPEGAVICGEFVQGGTTVGVTHYAITHSEQNWYDPEGFHPERFLVGSGGHHAFMANSNPQESKPDEKNVLDPELEKFANDRKDALQPFSFGPRNCIGRNLAYIEMRIILARMVWNFDLTLEPGTPVYDKQRIWIVWEKAPLMVNLTPVKR